MIDLTNKIIEIPNRTSNKIVKFEVWFQTPFGLFGTLDEAINKARSNDCDPDRIIVPVPVAIGPDGLYEICIR